MATSQEQLTVEPDTLAAEPRDALAAWRGAPPVLYTAEQVHRRVQALAREIAAGRSDRPLTLAVVLRGAFVFAADLIRALIEIGVRDLTVEFLSVASYRGMGSDTIRPDVHYVNGVFPGEGRDVLVVEDIIDRGHTLDAIERALSSHCEQFRVCALLDRPHLREVPSGPHYVGFTLDTDDFVVGYGLDLDGRYRELPYLGRLPAPPRR
ncbi:MAG TPA: phosphoribosyltransferase family protein [Candidatus Micrarchaeia archaeon]|nr:phosphoribosyltransferase family protein [Candidatus Micrarchaeia archaeon]